MASINRILVPVDGSVGSGRAVEKALFLAEKCQAGMIVMGSRGLGIFRGAFLGSVSQKVIEDAAIPVMVVK